MIIVPTEKRFDWNNAPIALFVIVILNVLVFYAYQTGDNDHFETAINTYVDEGLYQLEAPLYLEYLKQNQATEELDLFTQLQQHPNKMFGAALILQNEEFYLYLQTNGPELFDPYDHDFGNTNARRYKN